MVYYDLLKFGDQFAENEASEDLTEKGAESMFALGRSIQKFADNSKQFNMRDPEQTSCNDLLVYALRKKKVDRNKKSMTAFLFGLCSSEEALPTPFPEPSDIPS